MLYAAICDDNLTEARFTAQKVGEILGNDRVKTECFIQTGELLSSIEYCDCRPDIAILDIRMDGDTDGITLAKRLNEVVPGCAVIFLTGYEEYCSDAYSADHVFFIGKNKVDKYLPAALEKALNRIRTGTEKPSLMQFSVNGTSYSVPANEVVYLERRLRKTLITTSDRQYAVTSAPEVLLEKIKGETFVRCHQSFWVNCRYICGINMREILLRDGNIVPVSRSKAHTAKSAYFSSIGKSAGAFAKIVTEAEDEL